MAVFDNSNLLFNPFVVLSINPSATKEQVAEAYDEKQADGDVNDQLLRDSRRVLLIPNQRLSAELSYLIDTPERTAQHTLKRLRKSTDTSDTLSSALALSPVSRLNVLGHIGSISSTSELLIAFMDAQAAIDVGSVVKRCEKLRSVAEMPAPAKELVEQTLFILAERHLKSIFKSYDKASSAANDVLKCVEHTLRTQTVGRKNHIASLLAAYQDAIVLELSKFTSKIETSINDLKSRPDDNDAFKKLEESLVEWDRLSQPLQLYDQSLERDEPASKQMFRTVREVSIDLANDSQSYAMALAVSRLCLRIFAELPSAVEQLKEDLEYLDQKVLETSISPLAELVEALSEQPRELALELKRSSFSSSSGGVIAQLYSVFQSAIEITRETSSSDLPWGLLRTLALAFNNKHDDPQSSLAIIEGLVDHQLFKSISLQLRDQILEDEKAARENVLQRKFVNAVETKNFKSAEDLAEQLGQNASTIEKRAHYNNLRGKLREKNQPKGNWWPLLIMGAIVAFIIFSNSKSEKKYSASLPASTSRYYTPPPKISAPVDNDSGYTIIAPPPGRERDFTVENIRYCKREKLVLETIQPQIEYDSENVVDAFNTAVDDFNSRCSSYRFFQKDMDKITAEISRMTMALRQTGNERLSSWRANSRSVAAKGLTNTVIPEPEPSLPRSTFQPPKLNLLNVEDAAIVQTVLTDLGYFKGPQNGTWGKQSRLALAKFKRANGLDDNDGFDALTEEKLFGDAVRSVNSGYDDYPATQFTYPALAGAKMNPLNPDDATRINKALARLGLYKGKQFDLWSGLSRDALALFKSGKGMPRDSEWNGVVEEALMAEGQ